MTTGQILSWLEKDRLVNIDMIEQLRLGNAKVLAAGEHGVLQLVDDVYQLSAASPEAALELCEGFDLDIVYVHQQAAVEPVARRFNLKEDLWVYQVALFRTQPLPMPENGVELRPIGMEQADFVRAHYLTYQPEEDYGVSRLASGNMVGAFIGGEIVGFAGLHNEGSLGLLEVLPQYRRRGVGSSLSAYLVNQLLARGWVPYGQVELDNEPSLAMQRRMGASISTEKLAWLSKKG